MEKEYRISHVLIPLPDSPTQEDLQKSRSLADRIHEDLLDGADISGIAASYSGGNTALEGGDLGWRKYSQVPTLFVDFIATMELGDISELIRSPSGYHVIKLMGVRDAEELVVTQTLARHILIKPSEILTVDDVGNRLLSLKRRIESGDDFNELARGNSEDVVSAADGGDLGWVSPGDLVPEFEAVMNEMSMGQISEPFETQFGWHIVQVQDRRQHDSTDDIRRARAREVIRQRKMDEAMESWLQQLRDDAFVEYRMD
jgi:peptidyl-prolyl cis-trans isomerase SurA